MIQSGMAVIWHDIMQQSPSNDTNADRHFLTLNWFFHWQHLRPAAENTLLPPLLLAWFSSLHQSMTALFLLLCFSTGSLPGSINTVADPGGEQWGQLPPPPL